MEGRAEGGTGSGRGPVQKGCVSRGLCADSFWGRKGPGEDCSPARRKRWLQAAYVLLKSGKPLDLCIVRTTVFLDSCQGSWKAGKARFHRSRPAAPALQADGRPRLAQLSLVRLFPFWLTLSYSPGVRLCQLLRAHSAHTSTATPARGQNTV